MRFSFKKRVATYFMFATALIIAFVFGVVYVIVQQTVYQNIDNDLSIEANKHTDEIKLTENGIQFINKSEWEETEHKQVQVNPVFLQLMNSKGTLMDKSPNLKENQLKYNPEHADGDHFNTSLNNLPIRQAQIPILKNDKIEGYIIAAMSLDGAMMVLTNLRYTLFLLYPILLIGLFFISSFLAGRSILPIVMITKTANRITKSNLNERIELPQNKDELFDLSSAINSLLDRLENALAREKQFTSDASHELRTPLAVLRGTLEILIRKERPIAEYEEKIKFSLTEIDRMTEIIDELLTLARFDSSPELTPKSGIEIDQLIQHIIIERSTQIANRNIEIDVNGFTDGQILLVNSFHAHLILDNLINNAIKYSHKNGKISIDLTANDNFVNCQIKDNGIGIKTEDLNQIFTPFFRSDSLNHKDIKGVGLGLSITKKAADAIQADIKVTSEIGRGTTVNVTFNEVLRQS